jgi:molybdenum cofactor synthesis domain
MRQNISLEEAQELLLGKTIEPGENSVLLIDALGRIVSRDIVAPENSPFFDRSPLDGYALLASDTQDATLSRPVCLKVLEEVPAGYIAANKVTSGTAIKVMTGAPIPEGADVVVKYEEVERERGLVSIFKPLKSRNNIVYAGEDIKKGDLIAKQGSVVTPALIGLLAGFGLSSVFVYRRMKVGILSTGDELLEAGESVRPGKIYDSSRSTLQARCLELGAEPIMLGNVADRQDQVAERILEGLKHADMLITTGGVSVGDYDVVQDALKAIGAELIFWKVNIKPGSPILAATKDDKIIIGLSGSPVAALITFDVLVIPLLKKMMGQRKYLYSTVQGTLLDGFKKPSEKRRLLRARILVRNEKILIKLTGIQNNSALKSMLECNLFVDVPAGSGPLYPGDSVSAFIIGNVDGAM